MVSTGRRSSFQRARHLGRLRPAATGLLLAAIFASGTAPFAAPPDFATLTGQLWAADSDELAVPVTSSWQLELKWLVEEGSEVEASEPVARFDPAGVRDQLEQSEQELVAKRRELSLARSDGEIERLRLELELRRADTAARKAAIDAAVPQDALEKKTFAERQLAKSEAEKALRDARGALSTHEVSTRSEIAQLEIDIDQLERDVSERRKELDALTLRATRPGILTHASHPWTGEKIREGDQLRATFLVARIPDMSTLQVEAWAAETEVWRILSGSDATMVLDAVPERTFTGRVLDVSRSGETRRQWGESPWFRVRVSIDDADTDVMRPGMSVRVRLPLESMQRTMEDEAP